MNPDNHPTDPAVENRDGQDSKPTDHPADANPPADSTDPAAGESWPEADIDEAYLKALEAMEDIPWEDPQPVVESEASSDPVAAADGTLPFTVSAGVHRAVASTPSPEKESKTTSIAPTAVGPVSIMGTGSGPRLATGTDRAAETPEERLDVMPVQVIEAALFVGGAPLTAKKLAGLLRGSLDAAAIEQMIDDLNAKYVAEARPYEIRLRDGGYRLELRPEYDRLRHRVFGSGPREVRLSQEVIEVLALVAYRQPISHQEIEEYGKQNAGNLLRQLLRRDLVSIQRGDGGRKDIRYHTTARFLSVFGLGKISELPQVDDLALK